MRSSSERSFINPENMRMKIIESLEGHLQVAHTLFRIWATAVLADVKTHGATDIVAIRLFRRRRRRRRIIDGL